MYQQILVPVDLNEESSWRIALPRAIEYAKAFGASLHILAVIPSFGSPLVTGYFPKDFEDKARAETERQLQDLISAEIPAELSVDTDVASGTVYQRILETAVLRLVGEGHEYRGNFFRGILRRVIAEETQKPHTYDETRTDSDFEELYG